MVQTNHTVIFRIFCRQHNDGQPFGRRAGPQLFQDTQSILFRQHNVKQYKFWKFCVHGTPEFRGKCKPFCLKALAVQSVEH